MGKKKKSPDVEIEPEDDEELALFLMKVLECLGMNIEPLIGEFFKVFRGGE